MFGGARFTVAAAVLGAILVCGATVVLYRVDPAEASWLPPCPFHELTGFHCPGCGSSRAAHAMVHGRFGEALDRNPLLALFLPALVWMAYRERARRPIPAGIPWLALGVILAYWFLRNLPFAPFHLLSPELSFT